MTAITIARPTIVRTSAPAPPAEWSATAFAASPPLRCRGVFSPLAATADAGSTTRPHRAAVRERVRASSGTEDLPGDRPGSPGLECSTVLGQREELRAGALVLAHAAAEGRRGGAGAGLLDAADGHAEVLG